MAKNKFEKIIRMCSFEDSQNSLKRLTEALIQDEMSVACLLHCTQIRDKSFYKDINLKFDVDLWFFGPTKDTFWNFFGLTALILLKDKIDLSKIFSAISAQSTASLLLVNDEYITGALPRDKVLNQSIVDDIAHSGQVHLIYEVDEDSCDDKGFFVEQIFLTSICAPKIRSSFFEK